MTLTKAECTLNHMNVDMVWIRESVMNLADEMLRGAKSISTFTGFTEREIYEYARIGGVLPLFKVGKHICALRSELRDRCTGTSGSKEG